METLAVKAQPVLMDSQAKYAVMAVMAICYRLLTKRNPITAKRFGTAAGSLIVEEGAGACRT